MTQNQNHQVQNIYNCQTLLLSSPLFFNITFFFNISQLLPPFLPSSFLSLSSSPHSRWKLAETDHTPLSGITHSFPPDKDTSKPERGDCTEPQRSGCLESQQRHPEEEISKNINQLTPFFLLCSSPHHVPSFIQYLFCGLT